MTTVVFLRDAQGIAGFEISGHTGYAEQGSDIVCSAVSTATQATLMGIQEVLFLDVLVEKEEDRLLCQLPPFLTHNARVNVSILFETLRLTMKDIARQYPQNVEVFEKEVQHR